MHCLPICVPLVICHLLQNLQRKLFSLKCTNILQQASSTWKPNQFHSTETTLLQVKNDILLNMNQHVTLLALLDLSAAFDTVSSSILLNRLSRVFGLTGHVYSWFESYLHSRFQSISINSGISDELHIKYGVPQGLRLGPLLFVLYGSKLFKTIEQHLPNDNS